VVRHQGSSPKVEFEVFEPSTEEDVPGRTVTRSKPKCIACGVVLPADRLRAQLIKQHGGADVLFDAEGRRVGGARMLAVVMLRAGNSGRYYRVPNEHDYEATRKAQQRISQILDDWEGDGRRSVCPFPDEPVKRVPVPFGVINVWVYGMLRWGDLFTARQKLALRTLAAATANLTGPEDSAIQRLIAISVDKTADLGNALAPWKPDAECPVHLFSRQSIGMAWDFAESVPTCDASGSFFSAYERTSAAVASVVGLLSSGGHAQSADAAEHPLPDQSAAVWFTDPPYYDSVPYSYISDFFYVWLRRSMGMSDPALFIGALTPKAQEIVAYVDEKNPEESAYKSFERRMARAFAEGRRVLREDGVCSVVFAHKTTEGWEALLSGMIRAGWTITGSWPIATELGTRLRARDSAVLATSVHLICRPRTDNAGVGDWGGVLRDLPNRVGDWMERLQAEGVRGADLVFACIGPALEIFSRYAKVETAEGREVSLPDYLEKVWEVVGRSALAQILGTADARARNGAAGAVEEDARLTALFLWTLQSTSGEAGEDAGDEGEDEEAVNDEEEEEGTSRGKAKGFTMVFDVVRRFAQPLGIELPKWEGRVIETKKGVARLLPIAERAKQLFGEDGAQAVAARLELETAGGPNPLQGMLFPEMAAAPNVRGRGVRGHGGRMGVDVSDQSLAAAREATTLDRVHAAMLLQAGGRTNALRALLSATGVSSGARSSRRSGPQWTPRQPRRRHANSCSAGSRHVTRSTRRRFRCFSANGSHCRSTSRRAAR
jgi:putative DNA methylase